MSTKPGFVILGAGRPHHGSEHVALRSAGGDARVLDWLIGAFTFVRPAVHFVGGYQADDVAGKYPDFQYVLNADWETTGAAYSLLKSPLHEFTECFVSYADILFRESLIKAMAETEGDVVVAVDSHWRKRFSGRTTEDLIRCEKVFTHERLVTRLGADIKPELADAEFLGCVRLGERAISLLASDRVTLSELLRKASLSELIEWLRVRGMHIQAVDVVGDWAELNAPQDLAHFVLGTKAQTLQRLQGMVTRSRIEDQVSFTVAQWQKDTRSVLLRINQKFSGCTLVVRSSALSEDGFAHSNAGAYTSILNVDGASQEALCVAIEKVIDSYPDRDGYNQVLVQPMLASVLASGVVFTRALESGAPYYVVNYDDETGSTESITSGSSRHHKTLVIRRDALQDSPNLPENLRELLPALREVESLLGYDSLDIEFALSKDGLHILQVRPIAVDHSDVQVTDDEILCLLAQAQQHFVRLQAETPFCLGSSTIFGVMPDWNPAEIIGTKPSPLAMSLYRYLIMDEVWATQRAEYGYRDVRPHPLLVAFAGHPYVDVRASFNSFIPASLDDSLARRLVDFYIRWLIENPHLHDKVEFDVVPTCFALDFSKWALRLQQEGKFGGDDICKLREALKLITVNAVGRTDGDFQSIKSLEQRFDKIRVSQLSPIEKAWALLDDCRRFGTLPFAHLARSGFVAMTLLKSAVATDILSQDEMDDFLASIRTVSHTLTQDSVATASGKMEWEAFVAKYGHLRPGTYDITSSCYAADPERYLRPLVEQQSGGPAHVSSGELWQLARARFCNALVDEGLSFRTDALDAFLRTAIEGREYAKFIFSRNLSLALEQIVIWGQEIGLSRAELANISLGDILGFRTGAVTVSDPVSWLRQRVSESADSRRRVCAIELPPLITSAEDFSVFTYPSSQANFIGSGQVSARCIDLTQDLGDKDVTGMIALIPQADPGYDWLFGRGIAGLITMYGGANSHMAIRAAEFGLPAAIGIGEVAYREFVGASILELDPNNRLIRIIR
ncbi:PEP/pyruvate-binding domain-containing protein [Ectopseudomonas alcaliphila]|uniref:PEP/pyruvate-binding domain-containing protein n=1 Tax=Ectopseudomonas alcaliphila TaxID=101564 RepID=UPI00278B78B8|nr:MULTISPECIES: PEP/pyruvate-binding domain-containing protein [Pseudomonas]MDP9940104.1 choline kinase [Pseudomonas sp. 3400]MDR7012329.1 choline kinase [Pseudomonas alcaliphila]